MKTKLSQRNLAKAVGVTPAYISQICSRIRRPSPDIAKKLEKHSGVKAIVWLYPGDYFNPYLKDKTILTDSK